MVFVTLHRINEIERKKQKYNLSASFMNASPSCAFLSLIEEAIESSTISGGSEPRGIWLYLVVCERRRGKMSFFGNKKKEPIEESNVVENNVMTTGGKIDGTVVKNLQ